MIFDEFLAKLDRNNPYFNDIATGFEDDFRKKEVIFARKGHDLSEVVEHCKSIKLFPVVDKKLGLVFGCVGHSVPRQDLFRYHYYAEHPAIDDYIDADECEDRYIGEGHGWFISRMRPRIIVAGIAYRPDRFDRDVFAVHEIDHQDMSREERRSIIRGARRFR